MAEPLTLPPPTLALTLGRRLLVAALAVAPVALLTPAGRLTAALAFLLLAPGYLLERLLPAPRPAALIRLCLWVGLSLGTLPLLYQWLWLVRLPLAAAALWLAAALLAVGALVAAWRDLGAPSAAAPPAALWPVALTALIFALTLWTRFAQVDGVTIPPWVDSVHHALMVRVTAETGLAPDSMEPYMPVSELPYHWGYHVVIATVLRLAGAELAPALLLTGQLLNALHALTAAGMALALWRRPAAAPVAALVVGLISIMPAYYVSWGRYTQLTGLLMLPGLAVVWADALRQPRRSRWLAAALILAGLSLVHFRILVFAAAFIAAMSLVWAAGRTWPEVRPRLVGALAAGVGAGLLSAPWLALLVARALLPAIPDGGLAGGGSYNAMNTGLLWAGSNQLLAALALAGGLLALRWRRAVAATLLLWVGLMALTANPWLIGYLLPAAGAAILLDGALRRAPEPIIVGVALLLLNPALVPIPYLWLITNDVLVITLFLPFALLIAGGAAMLLDQASVSRLGRLAAPLAAALLLAAAGWGTYNSRSVINPGTVLAGPDDPAAIAWVAANTPPDARFLINAASWLPAARRGVDGGWWLLPLTGRWTSTPPVLSAYGSPEFVRHVNAVGDTVIAYAPGGEQAILDLIAAEGITHVYLTEGKGPLTPALFAGRPGFDEVYRQGQVVIFALR